MDLVEARVGVAVEQGLRGHDEAGRAETALLGVVLDECSLERMELARPAAPLDGLDGPALGLDGEHGAGVDGLAFEEDGAGAAGAAVADLLGAGEVEVVAQGVEQGDPGLESGLARLAIDL